MDCWSCVAGTTSLPTVGRFVGADVSGSPPAVAGRFAEVMGLLYPWVLEVLPHCLLLRYLLELGLYVSAKIVVVVFGLGAHIV